MIPVIQGNVISGNVVTVGTREPSMSSAPSANGSVRAPQPVGSYSPGTAQMGFYGTSPILNGLGSSLIQPQSEQIYPFFGASQVAPQISSAPSLAPRVVIPKREVPVSSFNPYPAGFAASSSSPLLTAGNLPRSAGVLSPPVISAPSNITQVGATVAPSIVGNEPDIRHLFDTADSNRDGLLEWNTGSVEAFGKAVLNKFGRDQEGCQILLYNTYDETDRNLDAKMDVDEGLQFARAILEKSRPKPQVAGPSSATSLFDTKASATSSAWDTHPNFVQREPYTGPVFSLPGSSPAPAASSEVLPSGSMVSPRHSEDSLEFQRLKSENVRLLEENRGLLQRLGDMEMSRQGQDLSGELAQQRMENERLSSIALDLQSRLEAREKQQVSSFDPMVNEKRLADLEEENQILQAQLASYSSDQSDIFRRLEQVQNENAVLQRNNNELQAQAKKYDGSQLEALRGRVGGAEVFGESGLLETLQEREQLMSKEIDELLQENRRLQEQALRSEPGAGPTDTKKKKLICC